MQFKNRAIRLKYILLPLAAVFVLSSRGFRTLVNNYLEYRRLNARKTELLDEKARLEKEMKAVKEPASIERAARKELGMRRPDELEYRFKPPSGEEGR